MFNRVTLIGHLTDPPVMGNTSPAICNFRVVTTEKWKNKTTGHPEDLPTYHQVVAWDKLAVVCGEILEKGALVFVDGIIHHRVRQAADGTKRHETEIKANNVLRLNRTKGLD